MESKAFLLKSGHGCLSVRFAEIEGLIELSKFLGPCGPLPFDLAIQSLLSAPVMSAGVNHDGPQGFLVEGYRGLMAAVVDAGTVSGRLGYGKDAVVLPRLTLYGLLDQALMLPEGGRQTGDKRVSSPIRRKLSSVTKALSAI